MNVNERKTSWSIIEGAVSGDAEARHRFAVLYSPALRSYFEDRWRNSRCLGSVDDAVQEVFVDCYKQAGALDRVEARRDGGFRPFFYGMARNIALRFERDARRAERQGAGANFDADSIEAEDDSASKVFDRAWARSIVREAVVLHYDRAQLLGERARLRVEILRLRFEEDTPIREIAKRLDVTPELAHREYARGRQSYQKVLEEVVAAHYGDGSIDIKERCCEIADLLD